MSSHKRHAKRLNHFASCIYVSFFSVLLDDLIKQPFIEGLSHIGIPITTRYQHFSSQHHGRKSKKLCYHAAMNYKHNKQSVSKQGKKIYLSPIQHPSSSSYARFIFAIQSGLYLRAVPPLSVPGLSLQRPPLGPVERLMERSRELQKWKHFNGKYVN